MIGWEAVMVQNSFKADPKYLKTYRISEDEYQMICKLLGREPEGLEWALFSALWSEHCSYKSSKVHLRKFYSKNDIVVDAEGENAGVIHLGQGEQVSFKMESHNHPSFISPHQGAATGVGGILRDIFTMGARPIALGNYLCFGEPKADRMSLIVDGVVRGIADYGNCVGVPMITGQTNFHSSYNGNVLVNAFALGYFGKEDQVYSSKAHGTGNYVVYVGAKTGKDGVHGASMASESFDEDSEDKKPTVQIGDPFYEKLLIEGCLEVMKLDLVEAIQDMGAAGLTSSSFEMSDGGGVGLHLHLDKVPARDSDITPEEILLSESQERMLLICKPENFAKISEVFDKWDLDAAVIGEVVDEKEITLFWKGEKQLKIDPSVLVENAPRYNRSYDEIPSKSVQDLKILDSDLKDGLNKIYSHIEGGSKNWIYQQYDQRVGARTAKDCSSSIGVVSLPETGRALSVVLGCRPYVMRMHPGLGGADAVIYPSLELAVKGFKSLAVTDCLNFGNPEKPELMSEFVAAVESMSEACKAIDAPVISGNVSLYNETLEKNVTSTPSTGIVGIKDDIQNIPSDKFQQNGDVAFVLRLPQVKTEGCYKEICGEQPKYSGELNNKELSEFVTGLKEIVLKNIITTSKVSGNFGLAFTLSKMCMSGMGLKVDNQEVFSSQGLFGESLYEVVLCVSKNQKEGFLQLASELKSKLNQLEIYELGTTGGSNLEINSQSVPVDHLFKEYNQSWEKNFEVLA